jgi:hypothetical protein
MIPGDCAIYRLFVGEETFWRVCDQVVCSIDSGKPIDGRRGWWKEQVAEYNRQRFDDLIATGRALIIVDELHRLRESIDQVTRYRSSKDWPGLHFTCCCSRRGHTKERPMPSTP